jgi:hypothetical protein
MGHPSEPRGGMATSQGKAHGGIPLCVPLHFEKDDDGNGHVACIAAMAVRAG